MQYGLTHGAGQHAAAGSSFISNGTARIHTVTLSGLAPATIYHYKVITGAAESALFHFKTPALQSAEAPTNIVAMSDMQRDNSQPNKFWEVVHNGVIDHVNDSMGPDLSEELAMIVIPGDLVDNGPDYGSWKTTFFDPANPLFSYVPVYPVLGNHEANTVHYFNYFQLPTNGTRGLRRALVVQGPQQRAHHRPEQQQRLPHTGAVGLAGRRAGRCLHRPRHRLRVRAAAPSAPQRTLDRRQHGVTPAR